jgi:ribonuclease HII
MVTFMPLSSSSSLPLTSVTPTASTENFSARLPLLPPTLQEETRLWASGLRHVAGIDEAGRGALAGPVVAAAVIVPPDINLGEADLAAVWSEVRDSKLLRPAVRAALEERIQGAALAWGVGIVAAAVIDQVGIATATRQAMLQALAALTLSPDYLLIDWVKLPQAEVPQLCVAKADQKMVSVAAASILAKVARDRLMVSLGECYPEYGFAAHKGYGSPQHLSAINRHGPCSEHRTSFAPISRLSKLSDAASETGL